MSTFDDDDIELDFFEEPETQEAPPRRRRRPAAPRRESQGPPMRPPTGAVALARLVGLIGIGIAVVVALVFWVGACQGRSRHDTYASYMEQVRAVAQSSAKVGRQLATKLGASGLKLADLETSLEQWSQQEQQAYDQAQQIRPPGPLRAVHQNVLDALQLRALGLAGLASTLAQTNAKDAAAAATQLAAQAQLLTASDIVWTELYKLPATRTLEDLGITGVVVPASQFVANADLVSVRSFQIVYERLRPASTGGTPSGLHGNSLVSTVAVSGGKSVTLSRTQPTTVYVSADLAFRVVVEDSGNFQELNVPVTLAIQTRSKTLVRKRQTIAVIQPAQQQTVSFGNLGADLPTAAYSDEAQVRVTVGGVPGEQKLDNNSASYPVFFSLSR